MLNLFIISSRMATVDLKQNIRNVLIKWKLSKKE